MRFHFLLLSLAVFIAALPTASSALAVASSFCDPATTTQTSCLAGPNKKCATLGQTNLDKDHKHIIACLNETGDNCAAGQCQWKAMTASSAATNCETGEFMTGLNDGNAVCSLLTSTGTSGGTFTKTMNPKTGLQCDSPNPLTGRCSCPKGYTPTKPLVIRTGGVLYICL